jgi:hypothetical protein
VETFDKRLLRQRKTVHANRHGTQVEIMERAAAEGISTDQFIDRLLHPRPPQIGAEPDTSEGDSGGKSVYEMFQDLIGTGSFEPTDIGRRAEEYVARGFDALSPLRKAQP